MVERYRRANETLHPTLSAVKGAVKGGRSPRKRRRLRALVPAGVAAAVAVALLVTGLPGLGGKTGGALAAYAISLPEYPDLPQYPADPAGDGQAAWDRFNRDYGAYLDAWWGYQQETASLSDTPALSAALEVYTNDSAALALAGEGNRIYSPVSLWFALAMLAETTGGETRQQVLSALGATDTDQLREWADILWHTIYRDDGISASLLGTSIWLDQDVGFHRDTLDALAEHYYTSSFQVPMGTDAADETLGSWVSEQTRGLIGSGGEVLETDDRTLAVLASTLYYKAGWADEFSPDQTEEDLFTAADGSESRGDFMHKTQDAFFLRQDGYQAAALGTNFGQVIFVLPDEGVTPADLLADPDFLTEAADVENGIFGEVQWSVPKFDVSSRLDLSATLTGLGVTDVFDPDASDFTPLTDTGPVWLEQAVQMARVKADEQGVEAAAVTLMANGGATPPPEDPMICVMDLDRPFLFLVRAGGVTLFVGVVEQV